MSECDFRAHFSDIAFAVADLVDNSIQAAQEAFEQNDRVSVMLSLLSLYFHNQMESGPLRFDLWMDVVPFTPLAPQEPHVC
jgi:hypothetical protein